MKATVNRKELLYAINRVKDAVSQKPTLPILSYFLLDMAKSKITLSACNLEVTATTSCEAKIDSVGKICLLAKPFEAILRTSQDKEVVILVTTNKEKVTSAKLICGFISTEIEHAKAEDYPSISQATGKPLTIRGFSDALGIVDYAIAKDECRPVLTGVALEKDKGIYNLIAADGFRLASTNVKGRGTLEKTIIIPALAVRMIRKNMENAIIRLSVSDNFTQVTVVDNDTTLTFNSIEGTYPNWKQLIPKKVKSISYNKSEIERALKAIMSISGKPNHIRLQSRAGEMNIYTLVDDKKTSTKISCTGCCRIAFNPKYLRDVISKVGDTVSMKFSTGESPALFREANSFHLLMPVMASWDK